MVRALMVLALAATLGAGCGDKKSSGPFPKPVLARLSKAGLKVGDFKTVDKPGRYGAKRCAEGSVSELAVLICEYESDEALKKATQKRYRFLGKAVTGAQRADGRVVLVVADRDKKDLRGKTIQKLLQAFKETKPF